MIVEHVWRFNFDPQTNVVEARMSRLKDKVDRNFEKKLIHSFHGVGYSLERLHSLRASVAFRLALLYAGILTVITLAQSVRSDLMRMHPVHSISTPCNSHELLELGLHRAGFLLPGMVHGKKGIVRRRASLRELRKPYRTAPSTAGSR